MIAVVALLGLCALAVALRVPVLGMPLDRDLAAFATIGQNLNEGLLPYRDLFDHKQPLTYPVYALIDLVFPRSTTAVRLAGGMVGGVAGWLLFMTLRSRAGSRAALLGGMLCVLAGATAHVEGSGLNTEHLMLAVQIGAVWAGLSARTTGAGLAAGALLGLAILAKATGVFLLPALALAVATGAPAGDRARRLCAAAAGVALPPAALVAAYAAAGGLDELWHANVSYNRLYIGTPFGAPLQLAKALWEPMLMAALAAMGGAWRLAQKPGDRLTWVLLAWLGGAVLGSLVGSWHLAHYAAPVVPPAAALLAVAILGAGQVWLRAFAGAAAAAVAVAAIVDVGARVGDGGREILVQQFGPQAQAWIDAESVGPLLRARAKPGDRLYARGSDPNVYWQSGIRPASRYFYNYPAIFDRRRWLAGAQRDLCEKLPRFLVRIRSVYLRDEPACLRRAAYVEIARRGVTVVYELRQREASSAASPAKSIRSRM